MPTDYRMCWQCRGPVTPTIETRALHHIAELRLECQDDTCGATRTPYFDGWHQGMRPQDIESVLSLLSPDQKAHFDAILYSRVNSGHYA